MDRFHPLRALALVLGAWTSLLCACPAAAHVRCGFSSPGARRVEMGPGLKPVGIHVPPLSPEDDPQPLVILLHGSTGTGAEMLRDSGLADTADRNGFLVAYPDGGINARTGFVWNIPGVPTVEGRIPGAGDRDDVRYIMTMVDRLVAAGCVDPTRVYVTGLSGGGRMASWLGCVASDRFAAIAPVVGLRAGNPLSDDTTRPDPRTCRPSRPISVIAFAGDEDRTNPIDGGGASYWQYTMHAAEQRWAQLNGCTGQPTTHWITPKVYQERYGTCQDGTEVIGRISIGEGHHWVVDNEALWQLLSRHRRGAKHG